MKSSAKFPFFSVWRKRELRYIGRNTKTMRRKNHIVPRLLAPTSATTVVKYRSCDSRQTTEILSCVCFRNTRAHRTSLDIKGSHMFRKASSIMQIDRNWTITWKSTSDKLFQQLSRLDRGGICSTTSAAVFRLSATRTILETHRPLVVKAIIAMEQSSRSGKTGSKSGVGNQPNNVKKSP